jgi:hypothetical protein
MKTHKPTPERLDGPGRHDPHLSILRNHINIKRGPFSDRGSRLLIFQAPGRSRLLVKLVERLTELQPMTPL